MWELWHGPSGNLMAEFATEDEARACVARYDEEHGQALAGQLEIYCENGSTEADR